MPQSSTWGHLSSPPAGFGVVPMVRGLLRVGAGPPWSPTEPPLHSLYIHLRNEAVAHPLRAERAAGSREGTRHILLKRVGPMTGRARCWALHVHTSRLSPLLMVPGGLRGVRRARDAYTGETQAQFTWQTAEAPGPSQCRGQTHKCTQVCAHMHTWKHIGAHMWTHTLGT